MRQTLAGMMCSKQFYHYDVDQWLSERGSDPFKANRKVGPRNDGWHHMYNGDVISMPDKWKYPRCLSGCFPRRLGIVLGKADIPIRRTKKTHRWLPWWPRFLASWRLSLRSRSAWQQLALTHAVKLCLKKPITVDFLLCREDFQAALCRGCSRA